MAEIKGIGHHGTICFLLRMMKMGLLTKEKTLDDLNEMIHKGWQCSTELYADIYKNYQVIGNDRSCQKATLLSHFKQGTEKEQSDYYHG